MPRLVLIHLHACHYLGVTTELSGFNHRKAASLSTTTFSVFFSFSFSFVLQFRFQPGVFRPPYMQGPLLVDY